MLFAFKRSKVAAAVILGMTVAVIILIWRRDMGRPVYIPVIASLLAGGVGILAARLLGNVLASMENTRDLGYLHMELDPEKFLKVYQEVPGHLRVGSRSGAVARGYLADGFWASGAFEKALETLSPLPEPADSALYGLYAAKRCACLQALGRTAEAEEALSHLAGAVAGCERAKPELAQNMKEQLTLYRQQQNALTGQAVDRKALLHLFDSAQYNLRRLEVARVFQLVELSGGPAAPEKTRTYLANGSGKTFFKKGQPVG